MPDPAPALHALLIGIDRYEPPAESGGFRYPSLFGAVADACRVERYLNATLGVPAERITRLLAAHHWNQPVRCPTYVNLVAALLELEAACRQGEQIVFYYSGHGGRAPTLLPEVKGIGGLDEVLAPSDIGDPAVPYLHDVEIAAWLDRMATRGVFVTMILDCCHSGGMPRSNRRARGSSRVDSTPRSSGWPLVSPSEIAAIWRAEAVDGGRDRVEVVPVRAQVPVGHAVLAACRPHETAVEVEREDTEWGGVMTAALLTALERSDEPSLTYRQLHGILTTRLHATGFVGQTPVVDGELDRLVFGCEKLPGHRGVEVLEVIRTPLGDRVLLSTGSVHGTRRGARFALLAGATGQVAATAAPPLAEAEVAEVGQSSSWAIVGGEIARRTVVHAGATAVLLDPGSSDFRRTVGWAGREGDSARKESERWAWLASLVDRHGHGFLAVAPAGAAGDFEVGEAEGAFEIRDAGGAPIPHLGPPIASADPGADRELIRRLTHLARYWNVRALENPAHTSRFDVVLRLRVERLSDPVQTGVPLRSGFGSERHSFLAIPGDSVFEVPPGSQVRLVVENAGLRELNVAVLDLQPDWGIQQVYPHRDGAPWATLEPGVPIAVELFAHLPRGLSEGVDVLKAIAATEPFDLASLECPALVAPPDPLRGDGRGAAVRGDLFGQEREATWTTAAVVLRVMGT